MFSALYRVESVEEAPNTYGRKNVTLEPIEYDDAGRPTVGSSVIVQTISMQLLEVLKIGSAVRLKVESA